VKDIFSVPIPFGEGKFALCAIVDPIGEVLLTIKHEINLGNLNTQTDS
jgi:hypothetical protein